MLPACYCFWPVQTGFGARTVDCLACYRGLFLAIEVKRSAGGKTTARQTRTLTEVRSAGGRAIEVQSLDQLREIIAEIDIELVPVR